MFKKKGEFQDFMEDFSKMDSYLTSMNLTHDKIVKKFEKYDKFNLIKNLQKFNESNLIKKSC